MQLHSSTTYKLCSQQACGIRHKPSLALPAPPPDRNSPGSPTVSFDNSLPAVRRGILALLIHEWRGLRMRALTVFDLAHKVSSSRSSV